MGHCRPDQAQECEYHEKAETASLRRSSSTSNSWTRVMARLLLTSWRRKSWTRRSSIDRDQRLPGSRFACQRLQCEIVGAIFRRCSTRSERRGQPRSGSWRCKARIPAPYRATRRRTGRPRPSLERPDCARRRSSRAAEPGDVRANESRSGVETCRSRAIPSTSCGLKRFISFQRVTAFLARARKSRKTNPHWCCRIV